MEIKDFIINFINSIKNNKVHVIDDATELGDYITIDLRNYHGINADAIIVQECKNSDYQVTIKKSGRKDIWNVTSDGRITRINS